MADKYTDFCTSPQDPIAKPPSDPKFSTSNGQFDGEAGPYPKRDVSPVISEKTYDKAFDGVPKDETRGDKA